MTNDNAVAYAALKEAIKKKTIASRIDVLFNERYPYTVAYCIEPPVTLFDAEPETKTVQRDTLRINVEIGATTTVEISGAGRVEGLMLRKMIKAAENAADLYFRAKAEGAGSR